MLFALRAKMSERSEKLVRSEAARKLAVYIVISNKGYRSPGFNDKPPQTNEEYQAIVDKLWHIVKCSKNDLPTARKDGFATEQNR